MVSPTFFVSGGVAVLHACSVIYVSFKRVKRWEHWYQRLPYTAHVAESVLVVHSAQASGAAAALSSRHAAVNCRFREDCDKLAQFVRKIEAFIMQTEDEADMTGPGWQAAFSVSSGSTHWASS